MRSFHNKIVSVDPAAIAAVDSSMMIGGETVKRGNNR